MMNWRDELARLSEGNEEYAEFNRRIVNTQKAVIGVRMPDMRKLARGMAKGMRVEDVREFMALVDSGRYEEVMLLAMLIEYAKLTDAERIGLVREYLPMVDSWALIDCTIRKRKGIDREAWWRFVDECLRSGGEFVVRYGVIFMMGNFLDELPEVFGKLRGVKHEGYYVKMGMAWLYATAAAVDFGLTMAEMRTQKIDAWTRRKGLTKMVESYRISDEEKEIVRGVRAGI